MRDLGQHDISHHAEKACAALLKKAPMPEPSDHSNQSLGKRSPVCLQSLFVGRITEIFNYKYQCKKDILLTLTNHYEADADHYDSITDADVILVNMSIFKNASKANDCYYLTMKLSITTGELPHHVHLLTEFAVEGGHISITMKDHTPSDSLCGKINECIQKALYSNDSALIPILIRITENISAGAKFSIS